MSETEVDRIDYLSVGGAFGGQSCDLVQHLSSFARYPSMMVVVKSRESFVDAASDSGSVLRR